MEVYLTTISEDSGPSRPDLSPVRTPGDQYCKSEEEVSDRKENGIREMAWIFQFLLWPLPAL